MKPIGVLLTGIGVACGLVALAGCSEIYTPSASEAIRQPFGTGGPFDRGTTKEAVKADWGEPDRIVYLGRDEFGSPKEEWVYNGRLPVVPIDVGYVSRTKRLFFEGDHLVRWETESFSNSSSNSN